MVCWPPAFHCQRWTGFLHVPHAEEGEFAGEEELKCCGILEVFYPDWRAIENLVLPLQQEGDLPTVVQGAYGHCGDESGSGLSALSGTRTRSIRSSVGSIGSVGEAS